MTDKELIQALRCCGANEEFGKCEECPAAEFGCADAFLFAADRLEALIVENESLAGQLARRNDELLKLREKVPKWVSVDERLPKHGETVLVYCDSATIESGKTVHIGSCDRLCGIPCWFLRNEIGIASYPNRDWSVTHWMPLPSIEGGWSE